MVSPETVEQFTILARQFGPFLFAILFIIFVPWISHKWYSECMKRTDPPASERERRAYRFYFLSTVWAGFIFVALATGWWFFENLSKSHLYQATIKSIEEGNIISSEYFSMSRERSLFPGGPTISDYIFVVVQDQPFEIGQKFELKYITKSMAEEAEDPNNGVIPLTLEIKYTGESSGVYSITMEDGEPRIAKSAEEEYRQIFASVPDLFIDRIPPLEIFDHTGGEQ